MVKYLAGFAMAKGIAIGGRGAILRGKVGAFAAGFFIGDTEKSAVVFPESAMPGFFVMNERQSMCDFVQHGAANQLRVIPTKPRYKMTGKGNAQQAVAAAAQTPNGAVPAELPRREPGSNHASQSIVLHGIGCCGCR